MQRRNFIIWAGMGMVGLKTPLLMAGIQPDSRSDKGVKDRLIKERFFQQAFEDDVILPPDHLALLGTCLGRLKRVQRHVGYGNFALLAFDQALYLGRNYPRIGAFTREEQDFMDALFHRDASVYGFMGDKPMVSLTARVNKKDVVKVARTGNYLFRGDPETVYRDILDQVGGDVVLTSGVRGMMKQFLLFLNKTQTCKGNLSMASRSLAPPGYSFHGVGDFDVGKKGFGIYNFTEQFTKTRIYYRLMDLGYIHFRYGRDNGLGVRFEPWHIQVV